MKKYTFFIAACLAFLVLSCKKGADGVKPNPNPGNGFFVRSVTTVSYDSLGDYDSTVLAYNYDAQGRNNSFYESTYETFQPSLNLPKITFLDTTVTSFGSNTIVLNTTGTSSYTGPVSPQRTTYYLNSAGTHADSILTVTLSNGVANGIGNFERYTYDANGYLTGIVLYDMKNNIRTESLVQTNTITNGELTMSISHSIAGGYTDTLTEEYNVPNAPATYPTINGDYISTHSLNGTQIKHAVSRITTKHLGISLITDLSYTFDSQGRVLQTVELLNGRLNEVANYTYE